MTEGNELGDVRRLPNGNVELRLGHIIAEFEPAQVDKLVQLMLKAAHPRDDMFVIQMDRKASHE